MAGAVLLSVLLYAYLGYIELVVRSDRPIQIDELFFATCAARSTQLGQWFSSGCHDNKGPVIYVVYAALHRIGGIYSYPVYKACALLLGVALAALAAQLAGRSSTVRHVRGWTFALVLQLFVLDPWLVALKTELVGVALVLGAIMLLDERASHPARTFAAGALLGLAFLTKQTFLFAVVPIGLVLLSRALMAGRGKAAAAWRQLLWFATGLTVAFGVIGLLFFARGDLADLLSSVFVYPAVYAQATEEGSVVKRSLLKLVTLSEAVQPFMYVFILGCAGAALSWRAESVDDSSRGGQARMVGATGLGMVLAVVVAPVFLRFHLLPALVMGAILGGIALAHLVMSVTRAGFSARRAVGASMAVLGCVLLLQAWGGPRANPARDEPRWSDFKVNGARGQFAYAIGTWPEFYVQSGFIPASGVMYPTALPGAPATWSHRPPDPKTWQGVKRLELQMRNATQLMADFRATPPRYVLVNPAMARSASSSRVTDIDVLDDYLVQHCHASGDKIDSALEYRVGELFTCEPEGAQ